jgi:DedD protein
MAERNKPEDDFNPRHRIVGAVILVALAVIFLPMLLSDRPPETAPRAVGDAPLPETRVVVAPVPVGKPDAPTIVPDKAGLTPPTTTMAVPVEPVAEKPIVETVPEKPAVEKPAATPQAEPKATRPASTAAKSSATKVWVVQVGVFSHPDNARRLQEKLKQKGYPAILDPSPTEKGKMVRVEAGPYKDSAAAKAAQARIQADLGIKGVVRTR